MSFQASIVCVLLSVVIFGFSFLSKALSGDDGRGLLGSQVGFVADLQDNANVYKEDSEALAKIAENYSDMQMQLATLNTQIANQMSQNGQLDDDLKSQINDIIHNNTELVNGSISAEHGIGLDKKRYLIKSRSEDEISLKRSIKKTIDPKNILNPGRVF